MHDVTTITIRTGETDANTGPGTDATVIVTVWFNFSIYKLSFSPSEGSTDYTFYDQSSSTSPHFEVIGSSNCHKSSYNNIPEAKMMIENNDVDGIVIDRVSITTNSGNWYGIHSFCIDASSYDDQWKMKTYSCPGGIDPGYHICIDNQALDCAPYKQMIHFDTTKTDQYIDEARWEDATHIFPEIITCDPTTEAPSSSPTTLAPSSSPTTLAPTLAPSDSPLTLSPSTNAPQSTSTEAPSSYLSTLQFTSYPTLSKGTATTFSTTRGFNTDERDDNEVNPKINETHITIALIVSGAIIFCICCVLCILFVLNVYPKHIKRTDMQMVEEPTQPPRVTRSAIDNPMKNTIAELMKVQQLNAKNGLQYNDNVTNVVTVEGDGEIVREVTSGKNSTSDIIGLEADEFIIEGDDEIITTQGV